MAKPGSNGARSIAQTGVDLSKLKALSPEVEAEARLKAELKLGMRCTGCEQRIGMGFKFSALEAIPGENGKPEVVRMSMSACNGIDGCDFAEAARKGATCVEMVEFVWLDEEGQSAKSIDEPERIVGNVEGRSPAE